MASLSQWIRQTERRDRSQSVPQSFRVSAAAAIPPVEPPRDTLPDLATESQVPRTQDLGEAAPRGQPARRRSKAVPRNGAQPLDDPAETREELLNRLLDPTLTLEEAAQVLRVCPTTVRRYTNRGVLPHFRTVGNQRRFRLSHVLAFLEAQAPELMPTAPVAEIGSKPLNGNGHHHISAPANGTSALGNASGGNVVHGHEPGITSEASSPAQGADDSVAQADEPPRARRRFGRKAHSLRPEARSGEAA